MDTPSFYHTLTCTTNCLLFCQAIKRKKLFGRKVSHFENWVAYMIHVHYINHVLMNCNYSNKVELLYI